MIARATAHAKINLALHVRGREPDGYHRLETLFAFCRDGDELELAEDGPPLTITGPFAAGLSAEADNLVCRAADGLAASFGFAAPPLRLTKRLPVAAGIGGGSADAAATLRLLCRLRGIDAADERVLALAMTLGADVPACMSAQPKRGEGRGERLTPLPSLAGAPVLLVNPGVPLATGPVFQGWDGVDRGALAGGDPLSAARAGRNDLEAPALALCPVIGRVLERLREQAGVRLARMSGSGATCFAMFEDDAARDRAAGAIAAAEGRWWCLATELM